MDKKNKPTPINRKQFYDTLPEPYQIPEQVVQPYDNTPKPPIYDNPEEPNLIRGNQISMKGDNSKVIRIGLEDHDEAILWYIENYLKPTVEINGNKRKVPVLMGSPERWKSIQKDGFYRDKNGKIQTPLIILKRESFEKNKSIGNKLDGNKVNNVQYFKQGYSKRNSYDNFSILQNQIPQEEYKVGIIPDYITLTYKLLIFTDYVEHMNQLIEAIEFASDSYWGDKERFQFRTTITNYPTPITVESGNDRASRSELTLTINGYIIPNSINVYEAAPSPKSYNITKFKFEENLLSVINKETIKVESISIPNNSVPQQNIDTSSFVLTSSFNNFTSSYNTGSFTGSFIGDGSQLTGIPTQSINLDYLITTSSFNSFTSSYNTGSFQGNLNGTASYSNISNTASYYDESDPIFTSLSSSIIYTSSFNNFTQSYQLDSSSFDYRINNLNIDTSSLLTSSSFNLYTSSVGLQEIINNNGLASQTGSGGETIYYNLTGEYIYKNFSVVSIKENNDLSSEETNFSTGLDRSSFNYLKLSSNQETAVQLELGITSEGNSEGFIGIGNEGEWTNIVKTESTNQDASETAKYLLQYPTPPKTSNKHVVKIRFPQIFITGTYYLVTNNDIEDFVTETEVYNAIFPLASDISNLNNLYQDLSNDKFDNPTGDNTQYLDGAGVPTTFPSIPSPQNLQQVNTEGAETTIPMLVKKADNSRSLEFRSDGFAIMADSGNTGMTLEAETPTGISGAGKVILKDVGDETKTIAYTDQIPTSIILYPTTASSDISGYSKLVSDVNDADYNDTAVDVSTGAITGTSVLISSLASAQGIFSGNITGIDITIVGNIKRVSGTANGTFYFEIYHRDSVGTETLIGISDITTQVSSATYVEFSANALISNENFNTTDRIVYKFYGNKVGGGSNPTFDFQFGGASPVRILTPVSANLLLQPVLDALSLKEDSINLDPLVKRRYFDDLQGFGIGAAAGSILFGTGTAESDGNIFCTRQGTGATFSRTAAEPGRGGIIRGGTGTTAFGVNLFQFRSIWMGTEDFITQTSVRVQTLSTPSQRYILTFTNGSGVIDSVRMFYSDDINGGRWQCETYSGSVATLIDSGIPVLFNTWYDLKVVRISMVVYFYINNVLVGTSSTNIPSNIESFCSITLTKTVGTLNRTCDFDYLKYFDL